MPKQQSPQTVTVTVKSDQPLSEAVCEALHPGEGSCEPTHLHESVPASVRQDVQGRLTGETAFAEHEWRTQLGIMVG